MHIIRTSSMRGLKWVYFICRFNVYFSRNQRKCSQNGENENLEI